MIKYRGYNEDIGKMQHGTLKFDGGALMLWSGRVDCDGVEVYDDDKLEMFISYPATVAVRHENGVWLLDSLESEHEAYLHEFKSNEFKVIGNIHEKEKKDEEVSIVTNAE